MPATECKCLVAVWNYENVIRRCVWSFRLVICVGSIKWEGSGREDSLSQIQNAPQDDNPRRSGTTKQQLHPSALQSHYVPVRIGPGGRSANAHRTLADCRRLRGQHATYTGDQQQKILEIYSFAGQSAFVVRVKYLRQFEYNKGRTMAWPLLAYVHVINGYARVLLTNSWLSTCGTSRRPT